MMYWHANAPGMQGGHQRLGVYDLDDHCGNGRIDLESHDISEARPQDVELRMDSGLDEVMVLEIDDTIDSVEFSEYVAPPRPIKERSD